MAAPLLTYRDAYEHLLDIFRQSGKDVGAQSRRMRRSVVEAYRLLPSLHDWEYFRKTASFTTDIPQTHASASYTAADRRVTISSGAWAANARFGAVEITRTRYPVKRRISDTVIELDDGPASDTAESMRWQRFKYLLPVDVGDVTEVIDPRQYFDLRRVTNVQTFWWQQVVNAETYPLVWSIFPSVDFPGRLELWLSGSGTIQRTMSYMYHSRHTSLPVDEVSSGTVSVEDDLAVFSSPVLTPSMVGAVLRVSPDATRPTSIFGSYLKDPVTGAESNALHPPEIECLITEVTDSANAVLSVTDIPDYDDRAYTISSHININYEGMWELFLRMAEEQYDIVSRADTAIRNVSKAERMNAMRSAMIADGPGMTRRKVNRWRGDIILEEES